MKNEKITETSKKFDFVSRKFSLFTSDFFLFEVCKRLSNQSYYDSTDFRFKNLDRFEIKPYVLIYKSSTMSREMTHFGAS